MTARLGTGHRGAISELLACAHLMELGYIVYRCESPHAPFDLVAYRDGVCYRVEVKSLTRSSAPHSYAPSFDAPKNEEWDLLAVADGANGRVFVFDRSTTIAEDRLEILRAYNIDVSAEPVLMSCGHAVIYLDAHRKNCKRLAAERNPSVEYVPQWERDLLDAQAAAERRGER